MSGHLFGHNSTPHKQNILSLLNEGKNAKIRALEDAITAEERAAAMLDSRYVVYDVLQVSLNGSVTLHVLSL